MLFLLVFLLPTIKWLYFSEGFLLVTAAVRLLSLHPLAVTSDSGRVGDVAAAAIVPVVIFYGIKP